VTAAETDPRVVASLREQLEDWRRAIEGGAARVGWKIGLNVPEIQQRLGLREPVIGHLTSASRIEPGGGYSAGDAAGLKAEPEIALFVGEDGDSVASVAPAIEIVDVGRPPAELESIVAANVFHRAFVLGEPRPPTDLAGVEAAISVNGERRDSAPAPEGFGDVVEVVARLLAAAGERLEPGDTIIAGSLTTPVDIAPGDEVSLELGALGTISVAIEP
jgi:2-keto-4-pentenoate hydratase